ncbi:hypothetical protein BU15DRAFT_70594 [Melanogaster broomeanus]|nr:hypothetical protein BU15DRAFT_70594 [Melanogaster broomeanus]
MSLRRFAQANAANIPGSPHSPSPRLSSGTQTPVTPRTRVSYIDSPSTTPSISSSTPFDWEAARSRRPPPYGTPLSAKRKPRKSTTNGAASPRKAVIRKKGLVESLTAIPSRIMFEISLFPHNVPLPAPKTSAWLIGALMHFLHFCVRVSQVRSTSDSDLGWEDLYWERNHHAWFDWTVPTTCILLIVSMLNALHLFTQTRMYQLHRRTKADPVSSPHTTFVPSPKRDPSPSVVGPVPKSTFVKRILHLLGSILLIFWRVFVSSVRFLLGLSSASPSTSSPPRGAPAEEVQQLEIWIPGELERTLLGVYSPPHALLWMCTGSTNWVMMCIVMGVVGVQIGALVQAYEGLVKDRAILSAEVMHEYNEGFVYPRVNPVRRDVAVMTHQSEMVNIWED